MPLLWVKQILLHSTFGFWILFSGVKGIDLHVAFPLPKLSLYFYLLDCLVLSTTETILGKKGCCKCCYMLINCLLMLFFHLCGDHKTNELIKVSLGSEVFHYPSLIHPNCNKRDDLVGRLAVHILARSPNSICQIQI